MESQAWSELTRLPYRLDAARSTKGEAGVRINLDVARMAPRRPQVFLTAAVLDLLATMD
jgi:hypothetical protein